ncbi:MAG: phosphosulfolactate synthase [Actinomycetota bacterium]|nr:phosphosulfolactate synthase [Actinomycetota bacterium]
MRLPSFLELPARSGKPRTTGLTHVLDTGVPPAAAAALLATGAAHIDVWKAGWGTAYVDPGLPEKVRLLAEGDVAACLGGTLLEIAWAQGRAEECLAWAEEVGFRYIEVSRGTVPMSLANKHDLVGLAAGRFVVLAEVGSKDPGEQPTPAQWHAEAQADLAAGARLVVTEGRASGTVGTFDAAGRVREDVVAAVVDGVGMEHVIFEAPRAEQQAWFVRRFGSEVNLGNVGLEQLMAVETLRLGLRSDTVRWDTAAVGTLAR